MHNRDSNGALASLSSVAKLPYTSCMDGISNTFCLTPTALGILAKQRASNLVSLLDGYFDTSPMNYGGGQHININVLNRALLEDAHLHPEKYPDLTIRVSGYAVRFNQLTEEQREEVLKRTMHGSSISSNSNVAAHQCECYNVDPTEIEDLVVSAAWFADGPEYYQYTEEPNNRPVVGSVHSLETFSSNDGPGIRTLVFLQGCPKRCKYCSNPETQCVVDPFHCPEVAVSDEQVVNVMKTYQHFLKPNNGGITLSGGEPLLQPAFTNAIFKRAHDLKLTTCLDTSGHGNRGIWDQCLPFTDYVMLCIKGMDLDLAAFVSGTSKEANMKARDFARYIRDKYSNIKLSLRWVLMKDLTDTDKEIQALAEFAKSLSPVFTHINLLPYHTLGKEKYEMLGRKYALEDMEPYDYDEAIKVQEKLIGMGVNTILQER